MKKSYLLEDGETVKESDIEKRLCEKVKSHGGKILKLACTGIAGIPDRLIVGSYGMTAFVEVKAPGKKPRKLQDKRIDELKRLGQNVFIVDSYDSVDKVIREVF